MSILVLTSDTLVASPATGQLEYNGQFYGTDSNAARAQMQRITQSTSVASTSGTSITFSSLPAWVKRITMMLATVSTNGSSFIQIQVGSGSATTTGYISSASVIGAASVTSSSSTTGFGTRLNSAANSFSGNFVLTLLTGNTWTGTGYFANPSVPETQFTSGSIALSGTLDRIILTTVNGTDTFDAGTVNIIYEG